MGGAKSLAAILSGERHFLEQLRTYNIRITITDICELPELHFRPKNPFVIQPFLHVIRSTNRIMRHVMRFESSEGG